MLYFHTPWKDQRTLHFIDFFRGYSKNIQKKWVKNYLPHPGSENFSASTLLLQCMVNYTRHYCKKYILWATQNLIVCSNYVWKTAQRAMTCSKLTIETLEQGMKYDQIYVRRHWRRSGVFIVNFEYISHLALAFLLLTLSR